MSQLKPLSHNENCRVQVISAPAAQDAHFAIFIEAREPTVVRREIDRLGGARGVIRAVFAEPVETPRETYVSHGFLCADKEFLCVCERRDPPQIRVPRNFLRWDLSSSRGESKR